MFQVHCSITRKIDLSGVYCYVSREQIYIFFNMSAKNKTHSHLRYDHLALFLMTVSLYQMVAL